MELDPSAQSAVNSIRQKSPNFLEKLLKFQIPAILIIAGLLLGSLHTVNSSSYQNQTPVNFTGQNETWVCMGAEPNLFCSKTELKKCHIDSQDQTIVCFTAS